MKSIKLTKEIIAGKLNSNPKWLYAGIVAIFNKQTVNEKCAESTNEDNGQGFTGCDAPFGSSLAKQLLAGRLLSIKQQAGAQRMMKKYAGQLLRIAKEKACNA